jgi:RHS repeat-associated protein
VRLRPGAPPVCKYGADGTRLKKIEADPQGGPDITTVYFAGVEIRDYGSGSETVLTYPHPWYRLSNGVASYTHTDGLGSVRAIVSGSGTVEKKSVYDPFGAAAHQISEPGATPETTTWIGERFDQDAGLQYLNARYYDPEPALFISPDWWDVTAPGVGTNRFACSGNDPVNLSDPGVDPGD